MESETYKIYEKNSHCDKTITKWLLLVGKRIKTVKTLKQESKQQKRCFCDTKKALFAASL